MISGIWTLNFSYFHSHVLNELCNYQCFGMCVDHTDVTKILNFIFKILRYSKVLLYSSINILKIPIIYLGPRLRSHPHFSCFLKSDKLKKFMYVKL